MKKSVLAAILVTSSFSSANSSDISPSYEYAEMRNVHHSGGGAGAGGGFGSGGYGGGGYGGSRGGISGRDISRDLDFKGGGVNRTEREGNKQKDRENKSEREDKDRKDRERRGGGGRNRKD